MGKVIPIVPKEILDDPDLMDLNVELKVLLHRERYLLGCLADVKKSIDETEEKIKTQAVGVMAKQN